MISKNKSISFRQPKHSKTSYPLFKALLILFISFSLFACASLGPAITACTVDVDKNGFDCVTYPSKKSFIAFSLGLDLLCASPEDTEDFLKACKEQNQILPITYCQLSIFEKYFTCTDPNGETSELPVKDADNYFCVSELNLKRIKQRCNPHQMGI